MALCLYPNPSTCPHDDTVHTSESNEWILKRDKSYHNILMDSLYHTLSFDTLIITIQQHLH